MTVRTVLVLVLLCPMTMVWIGCGSSAEPNHPPIQAWIDLVVLPYNSVDAFGGVDIVPGHVYGHFTAIPNGAIPQVLVTSGKNASVNIYDTTTFRWANSFGSNPSEPTGSEANFSFELVPRSEMLFDHVQGDTIYFIAYGFEAPIQMPTVDYRKRPVLTNSNLGPASNILSAIWKE